MRALLAYPVALLLFLSITFCVATEVTEDLLAKTIEMTREEIRLEAPHSSVFELRDLAQERIEVFFASFNISVLSEPLKVTGEHPVLHKNDKDELASLDLSPTTELPLSPTTRDSLILLVTGDQIQNYNISARVDLSTLKTESLPLLIKGFTKVLALKRARQPRIIPPGKSLNKLTKDPNAPRIYHRLFKVFSNYRNIMLNILKPALGFGHFEGSATKMFDVYNRHCWDFFLSNGSQSIRSSNLPISSIQTLNYRVGQFVKKGSLFATTKDGQLKPEQDDSILLSYKFEEENLVYTKIHIDNSSAVSPTQQAYIDYIIIAYEKGTLNLKTYKDNEDLVKVLKRGIEAVITRILTSSKTSPPFRPSYHPNQLETDNAPNILSHTDHLGRKLASVTSSRFESPVVRERVLMTEFNAWWRVLIPGSHVHFLSPSEVGSLNFRHPDLFKPMTAAPHLGSATHQTCPASHDTNEPWFFSVAFVTRSALCIGPAIITCPVIPIQNDPERVRELLDLASKLQDK